MSEAVCAAIDWGTTRFRAWLLDAAGEAIAERRSDEGMSALKREEFADVLETHLAAMDAGASLPVVICGMAGSRQGWLEAPYVDTPARFEEVFASAVAVPGGRIFVNRGMVAFCENEAELAAVLGHEIAHVALRQGARTFSRWLLLVAGITYVGDQEDVGRKYQKLRQQMGASMVLQGAADLVLGIQKGDEIWADRYGIWNAHAAGYDPRAAVDSFRAPADSFRAAAAMSPAVAASRVRRVSRVPRAPRAGSSKVTWIPSATRIARRTSSISRRPR